MLLNMPAPQRLSYLSADGGTMVGRSSPGGVVETPERRKVSLAGLGLIGAGAVLGLTLAGPGAPQNEAQAPSPPPNATAPADPKAPPTDS
jgi:hypothetical protein